MRSLQNGITATHAVGWRVGSFQNGITVTHAIGWRVGSFGSTRQATEPLPQRC